jgi:hypothetical protein
MPNLTHVVLSGGFYAGHAGGGQRELRAPRDE